MLQDFIVQESITSPYITSILITTTKFNSVNRVAVKLQNTCYDEAA